MSGLTHLIALLKRADGPSRDLDYRLAHAVGHPSRVPLELLPHLMEGSKAAKAVPLFTASLDAAVTLVPEGWEWSVRLSPHGHFEAYHARKWESGSDRSEAPTAALALCLAALRAREADETLSVPTPTQDTTP